MRVRRLEVAVSLSCISASVCWSCAGPIKQNSESFNASSTQSSDVVRSAHTVGGREIAAYAGRSLGDALSHLRPDWLRANPFVGGPDERTRPIVYTNDVPSGDVRALQTIPSEAAVEVQLLSATEAGIRYGPGCRCPAGVIRVRTRSLE